MYIGNLVHDERRRMPLSWWHRRHVSLSFGIVLLLLLERSLTMWYGFETGPVRIEGSMELADESTPLEATGQTGHHWPQLSGM